MYMLDVLITCRQDQNYISSLQDCTDSCLLQGSESFIAPITCEYLQKLVL